jgi:2-keto-4-pentenoate hydratase/2-oxohepta-3-ene-1,7-dioic acid hydratase in catechol pathway
VGEGDGPARPLGVRLYSYLRSGERLPRVAVGSAEALVDLQRAWRHVEGAEPGPVVRMLLKSINALIREGPHWWSEVADVARRAEDAPDARVDLDSARLVAPIGPASLRDFLAFEDHVQRGARRRGVEVPVYWYEAPVYYKGNHRAIIGPDEDCPWPPYARRLDFELELAMVIGRPGRDIPADSAGEHVFGFTIFDDFSARDVQTKEMSAWLGPAKAKDFANALGPCIVTADEVGTEPDLAMVCRVNGEEWGRARSSQARWSWAEMIAHVSRGEEVYPGDVYGSGTPGGCCGLDLGRELAPGDVVELEIERIGVLRNRITEPRA